ncbi:MAG: acetyl-CoA synthetase forming beta chain (AcdB) [Thermoplasmatales archaeon]|jgi:acyl-CoA synthetase (NDP forming)|nr:acetyl-CoA synthetase forming beta chain (AcdB) [Thermoplasmatales archaeon]
MNAAVKKLIKGRTGALAENEVKDLLQAYGIPTTKYQVVRKEKDLEALSVRFPVALKVCSSKILHKTDVGGVRLNIQNLLELKKVFQEFRQKFPTEDLLVDQMEEKGVEMIIGLVQDPTFGLSIMCGIGGIFTELYKDVSFRVVEIDRYDAVQMIEELAGKKLLEGFRGMKANKQLVIDLLLHVSKLGEELIDHVDQMDLNPVFVYEDRVCVVDAKLILK